MRALTVKSESHGSGTFREVIPKSHRECVQEFIHAIAHKCIYFRGELIVDGMIHRFASGEKGYKDCWYVFYGMAGAFGDWDRGIHERWSINKDDLTFADWVYPRVSSKCICYYILGKT